MCACVASHFAFLLTDSTETFLVMMSGGLAGSSHMTSATVNAIARLVIRFRGKSDCYLSSTFGHESSDSIIGLCQRGKAALSTGVFRCL